MKPLFRTALTVAIGAALVVVPSQVALAADHSAQLDAGYATITLDLGIDAANATASVLILDSDADVDSPQQGDIVYVNQLTMGADGTLQFRVLLDGGALADYVIASNVAGGVRYVAPLAEVAGGGGTTGPGGGSTGGGTGGGAGGGSGTGSGSTGGGSRPAGSALPWTGMAEWIAPTLASVGLLALVAGGAMLVVRRRRQAEPAAVEQGLPAADEVPDHL